MPCARATRQTCCGHACVARGRVQRARLDGRPCVCPVRECVYSDVVGPDIDGGGGAIDLSGQLDASHDWCGSISEILWPFGSLQKVSDLD